MITKQFLSTKTQTFSAYYNAEKYVKEKGYSYGSMCRDMPIALAKGDICIAKWKNIPSEEYERVDGLILSKDFREGGVLVIIFENGERYDEKENYFAIPLSCEN